jgi:hypothetical protein
MLFWIFVIALIVGIVCVIAGKLLWEHTRFDTEWLEGTGWVTVVTSGIAVVISLLVIIFSHVGIEAEIAANQEIYDSLTYQLENNLYDNDNDVGKKELYREIQEWNSDLAYYKALQNDFWLGIYCPNVFDQFEFIELP